MTVSSPLLPGRDRESAERTTALSRSRSARQLRQLHLHPLPLHRLEAWSTFRRVCRTACPRRDAIEREAFLQEGGKKQNGQKKTRNSKSFSLKSTY
jgi:hypothetical protein